MARFSSEALHYVRNELDIVGLIRGYLEIPNKLSEGYLRFECPECKEYFTAVNPQTNLSRCFRCEKNFNTIELTMADQSLGFVDAVKLLLDIKPLGEAKRPPPKPHWES